jgi:hypothetical protein
MLALAGCGSLYANPYPPVSPQPTVVPVTTKEGLRHHAEDVLSKAESVRRQAKDALALDGSPEAQAVYDEVAGWSPTRRQACLDHAKTLEAKSRTGSRAGVADFLTKPLAPILFSHSHGVMVGDADAMTILQVESDVGLAETAAQEAGAEAQKVADARASTQKKIDDEGPAVGAAADACAKDEQGCKSKCDGGDAAYCVAWAARLRNAKPPKLTEAQTYFQKACDAGMQRGCMSIPGVLQQIADVQAKVENLWGSVVEVGDDLAQKRHAATLLAQVASRPSQLRDLRQIQLVNAASIPERYCPARKAFLQVTGAAEFQRRAVAHCKDSPPTGPGLSGAQVTLSAECTAVYATACP